MGTRFVVCGCCRRHVRASEGACPFCGGAITVQPRTRAGVVAASVLAAAMAGCGGAQPTPVYGPPPNEEPPPAVTPPEDAEPVEEGELPPPVPEEETEAPPEVEGPDEPVVMYGPPPR